MPNLGEILNKDLKIAAATTQQRQQILDKVYEGMKASGKVSSEKLRQFRQDQMNTFLADDYREREKPYKEPTYEHTGTPLPGQGGFTHIDNKAGGSSILGANISQYLPADRETYTKLARRNALESLKDIGRVVTDPSNIGAALGKFASDMAGLGFAAMASGATQGPLVAAAIRQSQEGADKQLPSPSEALGLYNKLDFVKNINQWYEDVIKDDPEYSKYYHAALVDATVGMVFGAGRVASLAINAAADAAAVRAGAMAAEAAAPAVTGLGKLREIMAPVVSNVIGGQLVYQGIEGLDESLEGTDFTDSEKTGIRLGAILTIGLASGIGPERWIENIVKREPSAVRAASQLGQVAEQAENEGKSFAQALRENPLISEETKRELGVIDEVDPTTGQILNPTDLSRTAEEIGEALSRNGTSLELNTRYARMIQALRPEFTISPLKPEEVAENLGGLSTQTTRLALPQSPERLALTARTEEATSASGIAIPPSSSSAEGVTEVAPKPRYAPPGSTRVPAQDTTEVNRPISDLFKRHPVPNASSTDPTEQAAWRNYYGGYRLNSSDVIRLAPDTSDFTPEMRRLFEDNEAVAIEGITPAQMRRVEEERAKRDTANRLLANRSSLEAEQSQATKPVEVPSSTQPKKNALPTFDDLTLSRKAIESIDLLTSTGREAQAILRSATKRGDTELAARAQDAIKRVQEQVADHQRLIALELGGSRDLLRLVQNELKDIDNQLKGMRDEWRTTPLQARRVELEEKAAALKQRQQILKDRRLVFSRIPDRLNKNQRRVLLEERDRRIFSREPQPSQPWREKVTRTDAETKLSQLDEVDRLNVMKVHRTAQLGTEDILGRQLNEEERLDLLANVLNDRRTWGKNPWHPRQEAVVSNYRTNLVPGGYVGERYPDLGKVLSILHPRNAEAGMFTPDQVLQLAQGLTARAGLGMDAEGWQLSRDLLDQSYRLWDDIRGALPKAKGDNLKEFLSRAMPGSRPTTVQKVSDTITRAFPELDLSFQMDALPRGVAATADSLTKMITTGLNKVELKELMHEIGHLNFWHGMNAETRMSWMDSMRERSFDEVSWANAFPEYAERQLANAELDEVARAQSEFWLQNPSEMYAQQFSAYALSNVLPSAETLGTFQRAWRGLKRTIGLAADSWDTLPPETKQFMLKTLVAPSPAEARAIPRADIEEGLRNSWLYSDKPEAEARVFEMRQMLEGTYGQRMERIPTSESQFSDVVQEGPAVSFFSLPVEQRVASYALNDLPMVGEMQALSILHDLPGASWDELKGVIARLHDNLSGDRRAELLDGMVSNMQKQGTPYDASFDPSIGQSRSPAEIAEENTMGAIQEYNWLSQTSKNLIEKDNANKFKRELAQRRDAAEIFLRQRAEATGSKAPTREEVQDLVDSLRKERPSTELEGAFRSQYAELQEIPTTTEDLYSQASRQLAALDVAKDDLTDFTKYVLAHKGMAQPIDPSFTQRLSKAEKYANFATQQNLRWPELALRTLPQFGFAALTGLEYDPDGVYIPWLGTVTWSPEKFYETAPLAFLLMPGATRGLSKVGRAGAKVTKPYVEAAYKKLPMGTRLKMASLGKTLRKGFILSGGLPEDLTRMMRNAQVAAQAKKQEFYAFAETMHRIFSREEREVIAKLYEQQPGTEALYAEAALNRPDIIGAIEMTRKLYSTIPKTFKEIGLWSKNFEDLEGHYINRLYDGIGKKPTSAIFLNYNISPVRMNFLRKRGIEDVVRNTKKSEPGRAAQDALTQLRANAQEAGVELREGLKLNAWEGPNGTLLYSIPDTAFDKSLQAQKMTPMYRWGEGGNGYVVEEVRRGSLKIRRDYTPEERKGMGEVVDVAVRSAAMGEQLERDIRQGRAFFNVANSKYAKKAADEFEGKELEAQGWKLVSDALDKQTGLRKYGELAGMYVHPDAWDALQTMTGRGVLQKLGDRFESLAPFIRAHQKLLGAWKVSKTVLSPVAHVNNFVSNMFMGYMMGHNPIKDLRLGLQMSELRNLELRSRKLASEGKAEEAVAVLKQMEQHQFWPYFKEMRDARMSDSSLWANELRSDTLLDELRQADASQASSEIGRMGRALNAGYNAIEKAWNGATKFAGGWYEKGDLIYKMGSFVAARQAGRSPDEAVKYAYEAYFDYGNLSPVARALRDTGVVPFVSYLYNAIPALAKSIAQHPERLATVGLFLEGLHLAGVSSLYGGDEVIKNAEAVDTATPDYMQRRGLGGILRTRPLLPGTSGPVEEGGGIMRHRFFDMTRMMPGGDLLEAKMGANDVDFSLNSAGELLFKFINQGPMMGSITTAATGESPIGQRMSDGGNLDTSTTRDRRDANYRDMLYNTIVPNLPFIPGTPSFNAITDALKPATGAEWGDTTGLDNLGLPKSLGTAIAGTFGVKLRDIYPEDSLGRQMQYTEGQLQKEENRLNRILNSPRYTQEYKEEEVKKFAQTVQEVGDKQMRRGQMLQRLNDARRTAQGGQSLPH